MFSHARFSFTISLLLISAQVLGALFSVYLAGGMVVGAQIFSSLQKTSNALGTFGGFVESCPPDTDGAVELTLVLSGLDLSSV